MSSLFCCCCAPCCNQIGVACGKFIGTRKITQLSYISLVLSFVIPVSLLTFVLYQLNVLKNITFGLINIQTPTQVFIRMSFALMILFLIMLLFMLCRNKVSQVINEGLFCVKFTVLIVLFVLTFLLPPGVLMVYASIAKITSVLFMVIQTVILIDLFYLYAINLVRKYDEGNNCCAGFLIGATVCTFTVALFLIVFAFIEFSHGLCGSTSWLTVVTLIILLVLPLVQLLNFNPQNSLFTTSLVSLLISYTAFAAQQYYITGCVFRLTIAGFIVEVVISLLLFTLSMYGTVMGGFSANEYEDQPGQAIGNDPNHEPKPNSVDEGDTIHEYADHWGWIRWHFYMMLGVMYLGMVFSNWQPSTNVLGQSLKGNSFVFWLKTAISWFTALAYIWTLIAPKLFPNRDFRVG